MPEDRTMKKSVDRKWNESDVVEKLTSSRPACVRIVV